MVLAVDGGESVNGSLEPSEVECLSGGPNQAPPLLRGFALLRDPFTPTLISSPQQIRSYPDVDPCRVIPLALVHAIEESLSYHLVLIAADRLSLSGSLPPCRSLRSPETRPTFNAQVASDTTWAFLCSTLTKLDLGYISLGLSRTKQKLPLAPLDQVYISARGPDPSGPAPRAPHLRYIWGFAVHHDALAAFLGNPMPVVCNSKPS